MKNEQWRQQLFLCGLFTYLKSHYAMHSIYKCGACTMHIHLFWLNDIVCYVKKSRKKLYLPNQQQNRHMDYIIQYQTTKENEKKWLSMKYVRVNPNPAFCSYSVFIVCAFLIRIIKITRAREMCRWGYFNTFLQKKIASREWMHFSQELTHSNIHCHTDTHAHAK